MSSPKASKYNLGKTSSWINGIDINNLKIIIKDKIEI